MKGFSRKNDLSLMTCSEGSSSSSSKDWDSEDTKLELRLGPPGDEDWNIKKDSIPQTSKNNRPKRDTSSSTFLSLGCFSNMNNGSYHNFFGSFQENTSQVLDNTTVTPWSISCSQYKQFLPPAMGKGSLQMKDSAEKKGFSPASANNTAFTTALRKAMKKLNGVREMFETKPPESRKRRKTCDDIINMILEKLERLAIEEKVREWDDDMEAIRGEARRGAKSALEAAKFLLKEEDKENGEEKFMMHVPLPDEKELERTLVKKLKLSSKYASRDLLEEQRETKAMFNILF